MDSEDEFHVKNKKREETHYTSKSHIDYMVHYRLWPQVTPLG